MPVILNKFREYQVSPNTEVLILGNFSADSSDAPDFFYGRAKSFLWHLLPQCWGLDSLKEATLKEKNDFMSKYKIDFADLIDALDVPDGEEANVDDSFIDSHVQKWKDIISLIDQLPNLKAVYFTRKTFNGAPNIKAESSLRTIAKEEISEFANWRLLHVFLVLKSNNNGLIQLCCKLLV